MQTKAKLSQLEKCIIIKKEAITQAMFYYIKKQGNIQRFKY